MKQWSTSSSSVGVSIYSSVFVVCPSVRLFEFLNTFHDDMILSQRQSDGSRCGVDDGGERAGDEIERSYGNYLWLLIYHLS